MEKVRANLRGRYLANGYTPLLALLFLLLISGVSIKFSIFAAFLIASHSVFGSFVYSKFISKQEWIPISGVGFAVGTLLAIVTDQIFVTTPLRDKSWVIIPFASIYLIAHQTKNSNFQKVSIRNQIPWLSLIFLSLVGLIQERYWPLWVALGMMPLIAIANLSVQKLRKTLICSTSVISAITFMAVMRNRPQLWWIKTQDFQFFESLSYSLAHWGWRDQVYAHGYPIYYHWLTFAWTGMFTRIMNAPTWLVLSKIAPPVVILFLILLLNEVLNLFSLTRLQKTVVLLILLLLNDFNFESPSMIFSYLFLLAFLLVTADFFKSGKLIPAIGAALLAGASLASKSSNIAILIGGLIGIFIYGWKFGSTTLSKIFAFTTICGSVLVSIFYLFYFSSPYSGNIGLGVAGISRDYYGDLISLPRFGFILWSIIVVVNLMIFLSIGILAMMRRNEIRSNLVFWYFIGATPCSLIPLLVLYSVHEQEEYFYHSWTLIGSIIFLAYMVQYAIPKTRLGNIRSVALRAAILVIMTTGINFILHDDRSGSVRAIQVRVIRGSLILQLLVVLVVVAVIELAIRRRTNWSNLFMSFFIAGTLILIASLNSQWVNHEQQFRNEVTSSTHHDFMLGTTEEMEIGNSISLKTPENSIIASNYFCDNPCDASTYSPYRANWSVGGEAMFLAVYSHRRFLVTGYGYMWQNVPPSPDVIKRMDVSLRFGSEPSEKLLKDLLSYNVDYFVVDKTMSKVDNWSQFASIISSNDRFELLKLKIVS